MSSSAPQLRQIRASAGSGKTYELTTSFLKHLSGAAEAGGGPFSGCSAVHSGPHGWPEILAVTFTNRAAAEMQERIIGRLKDTALGTDKPAPGWTREQARRWVGIILRRYGALNVRTIDSLLHLIVRLTALELDLPPDFEPVFATDEAIAPLLDSLLEQSRSDERLHALLEEACRNVFFHSPQRGFLAGETLRGRVMELLLPIMKTQSVALAHPSEITERLGAMTRDLRDAVEALHRRLAEEKLSCSAHLTRALDACRKAAPANLPPNSTMLRKACLDDCLNKASKGKASPDAERAFDAMRDIIRKWDEAGVLLRRAQTVMPFVELARELSDQVPDFLKREGAVPAAFVPRLARQVLSGDYGVPEAFCRLGTSLTHILVDEFQDTSREQWEAIHPLVLEALSRGGSLTWVGDVKQAIYGWRGGDATLFDEVRSDEELCAVVLAVAAGPEAEVLPRIGRGADGDAGLGLEKVHAGDIGLHLGHQGDAGRGAVETGELVLGQEGDGRVRVGDRRRRRVGGGVRSAGLAGSEHRRPEAEAHHPQEAAAGDHLFHIKNLRVSTGSPRQRRRWGRRRCFRGRATGRWSPSGRSRSPAAR